MKDFLTTLKQFFRVNYRELRRTCIWSLVIGIVGVIVILVTLYAADPSEEYVDAGSLLTVIFSGLILLELSVFTLPNKFYLAVAMGRTRTHFLGAAYCFYIIEISIILVLAKLISLVEIALYGTLFPEYSCEFVSTVWMSNPIILLCVIFGLPVLLLSVGVFWMRFKNIFWLLWSIWMFGFLGVPKIITATTNEPNSLPGRIGNAIVTFFQALPPAAPVLGIIAILVACMCGSIHLIKKHTVAA